MRILLKLLVLISLTATFYFAAQNFSRPQIVIDEDANLSLSGIKNQLPAQFMGFDGEVWTNEDQSSLRCEYGDEVLVQVRFFDSSAEIFPFLFIDGDSENGESELRDGVLTKRKISSFEYLEPWGEYKTSDGYSGLFILNGSVLTILEAPNSRILDNLITDVPWLDFYFQKVSRFFYPLKSRYPGLYGFVFFLLGILILYRFRNILVDLFSITLMKRPNKNAKYLNGKELKALFFALNDKYQTIAVSENQRYTVVIDWNYLNDRLFPETFFKRNKVSRLYLSFDEYYGTVHAAVRRRTVKKDPSLKKSLQFYYSFLLFPRKRFREKHLDKSWGKDSFESVNRQDLEENKYRIDVLVPMIKEYVIENGWYWKPGINIRRQRTEESLNEAL